MARRAKASDMRHKAGVYKQVNVRNPDRGTIEQRWVKDFEIWVRESTIFREQLENVISGAETLRDRIEFETRYTNRIKSSHRLLHKGKLYRISIEGDTDGTMDRTRFLGERIEDGGA